MSLPEGLADGVATDSAFLTVGSSPDDGGEWMLLNPACEGLSKESENGRRSSCNNFASGNSK